MSRRSLDLRLQDVPVVDELVRLHALHHRRVRVELQPEALPGDLHHRHAPAPGLALGLVELVVVAYCPPDAERRVEPKILKLRRDLGLRESPL